MSTPPRDNAQLQSVLNAVLDGVITIDEQGIVQTINPAAEQMFGYERGEILGQTIDWLMGAPYQTTHDHYLRAYFESGEKKVIGANREVVGRRKNGTTFPMEISVGEVQHGGGRWFVGVVRDLTQHKLLAAAVCERDAVLPLFIENAPASIAMFDREMRYLAASQRWIASYRLDQRDLFGRSQYEVFPDLPERWKAVHRRALAGETIKSDEDRFERANGDVCWLRWEVRPWRQADDTVGGIIIFSEDITGRKSAELELAASRDQIRAYAIHLDGAIEKERVRMAREIHDDLGQTLTGIKMDLAALRRRLHAPPDDDMPRTLEARIEDISQAADTAISIVRRIATELRPPLLERVGLKSAIQMQCRIFSERTGIPCVTNSVQDVVVDEAHAIGVYRIFQEALTNIARHARATQVVVDLHRHEERLCLVVRNDGRAITEAELADSHSFGLIGMRERARMLGGTVTISGYPGTGTEVRLDLPLPS